MPQSKALPVQELSQTRSLPGLTSPFDPSQPAALAAHPPGRLATAAPRTRAAVGEAASLSTLPAWLNSKWRTGTGSTGERVPVTDPTLPEARIGRGGKGRAWGGGGAHLRW